MKKISINIHRQYQINIFLLFSHTHALLSLSFFELYVLYKNLEKNKETENKILINAYNQEATLCIFPANCFLKPIFIYIVEMIYNIQIFILFFSLIKTSIFKF